MLGDRGAAGGGHERGGGGDVEALAGAAAASAAGVEQMRGPRGDFRGDRAHRQRGAGDLFDRFAFGLQAR